MNLCARLDRMESWLPDTPAEIRVVFVHPDDTVSEGPENYTRAEWEAREKERPALTIRVNLIPPRPEP